MSKTLNPRQLQAFSATMRSGSITAAAKLLFISQPSVSRLISDLESAIGFSLFVRTGHGLVATPEARRFHQNVESMFIGLEKLQAAAEVIRTTENDAIAIGVIPVFGSNITPTAIRQYKKRQADLKLDVFVKNTPEIIDAILLQQLDLGIICPTHQHHGLHVIHHTTVNYRCLIPTSHRLATPNAVIDLNQLHGEDLITLDPSYLKSVCTEPSAITQLEPTIHIIAHSDPAIAAIATENQYIAIVDPFTADNAAMNGEMLSLPLQQTLSYPISVVAKSATTLSIGATELAGELVSTLNASPYHA